MVIDKAAYSLSLYQSGRLIETFNIELGFNPIDDKFLEGDGCTPEGIYRVTKVRDIGDTHYYRAFMIDYPTSTDKKELLDIKADKKVPYIESAGGLIEIHGNGSGKKGKSDGSNWTLGCIALSNSSMDKLFDYKISAGTPITIVRYGMMDSYEF